MTTTTPTFDCIAERYLEYRERPDEAPRKALIRLGRPYVEAPSAEDADFNSSSWVGPFEIIVEGKDVRASQAYGMDAVQALQLAMVRIGLNLQHTYPGQFTIEGGNGHTGFPTSAVLP